MRGDEKKATVPLDCVRYRGVCLQSRWRHQREIDAMRRVVDTLPDSLRVRVSQMFCDSQVCASYVVTPSTPCSPLVTRILLEALHFLFLYFEGGHNGICLHDPDGNPVATAEPNWAEPKLPAQAGLIPGEQLN